MNLHTVVFDAETKDLTFTCQGSLTDECHIWPDDLGTWSNETPRDAFVSHDRCWMSDWFDNNAVEYLGEDGEEADDTFGNTVPAITRGGLIESWFREDFIEWDWA